MRWIPPPQHVYLPRLSVAWVMKFGSLFAGIGGFDLGLERAGMECIWQVEIDDFCNRVLEKHWPHVKRYRDVREVGKHNLEPVDLICGGFPCQDISLANQAGVGLDGERSGLWFEFERIIGELRPRVAIIENTPGLLFRGMERVLGGLASLGYDAEWHCIPASAIGAPHVRDRVWIIAHTPEKRWDAFPILLGEFGKNSHAGWMVEYRRGVSRTVPMPTDSTLFRVDDGVPETMDRLGSLGNAVVPQVVEIIGRAIMEAERI